MTRVGSGDERIRTDTADRIPVTDTWTPAGSPTVVSVGFSTTSVDALRTTTNATKVGDGRRRQHDEDEASRIFPDGPQNRATTARRRRR